MRALINRRLVRDYYLAIDADDLDRALAPFDAACLYERQGHGVMRGAEAVRDFYLTHRVIARGEHRLEHVLGEGDWVSVRGVFKGTLKSGEQVELSFTDWFRILDQRIVYRQSLFPAREV